VNLASAPKTILTFVAIAGKLGKGEHRRPWRRTGQWKDLVERLAEYIHGVEASGDADWKELARWVRSEARAAKVKVPRMGKLPPRPTFGKRASSARAGSHFAASIGPGPRNLRLQVDHSSVPG
jgi:hypothetical protein